MSHACSDSCKYVTEEEVWAETKFSDRHRVSNHGRFQHKVSKNIIRGSCRSGYVSVRTTTKKICYLHRLVAFAFLPNPKNLPFVNHLDGNPLNNHVSNLEWVSHSENIKHAYKIGHIKRKKTPILKISSKTNEIQEFFSITEAAKSVCGTNSVNWAETKIRQVCRG